MFTARPTAVTASLPLQESVLGENFGQIGRWTDDLAVLGMVSVRSTNRSTRPTDGRQHSPGDGRRQRDRKRQHPDRVDPPGQDSLHRTGTVDDRITGRDAREEHPQSFTPS
jgi:hypothetical protein